MTPLTAFDHRGISRSNDSLLPLRFLTHSFNALNVATNLGWLPGARYSNLRDVRRFDRLGFLDINWRNYSFSAHVAAAKATRPMLTVARDIEDISDLDEVLCQARELLRHSDDVVIVPKDPRFGEGLEERIPRDFILGFSVPTRYGGTTLCPTLFRRPVHLLGGRPDVQRRLAATLSVHSIDCNRFTLDAAFGDYFDGVRFKPHPIGGYRECLTDSIHNINRIWLGYSGANQGKLT